MNRLRHLLLWVGISLCGGFAQEVPQLREGPTYSLPGDGDKIHEFTVALQQDDLLVVTIGNTPADLWLYRDSVIEAEVLAGEPCPLIFITRQAGDYRLKVLGKNRGEKVRVTCRALRPASRGDVDTVAAFERYRQHLQRLALPYRPEVRRASLMFIGAMAESFERLGEAELTARFWDEQARGWAFLGESKANEWLCRGKALRALGRNDTAVTAFYQAIEQAQCENTPEQLGTALNDLGLILQKRGDAYQALDYFNRADELYSDQGIDLYRLKTLCHIGLAYQRLGKTELALDHLREGLALALELERENPGPGTGEHVSRGQKVVYLIEIGWCLLFLDREQEAENYLREGLELARHLGDIQREAGALDRLGTFFYRRKHWALAEERYAAALNLVSSVQDRAGAVHARINLTRVLLEQGRLREAAALVRHIIKDSRERGMLNTEIIGLYLDARRLFLQGDHEAGLATNHIALDLVEAERLRLLDLDLRLAYTQTRDPIFRLQLDLLMAPDRHEEALAFTNLVRSLYYLERLELEAAGKADDPLADLRDRIVTLTEQRLALEPIPANDHRRQQLERTVRGMLRDYEQQRVRHFKTAGRGFQSVGGSASDLATRLQRELGEDTRMLVYGFGEDRVYLWLIHQGRIQPISLASSREVNEAVSEYRRLISAGPYHLKRHALEALAARLGVYLLGPVESQLEGSVVIVPDGVLHLLPFASLLLPRTKRYLVEQVDIRIMPNLSDGPAPGAELSLPRNSWLLVGDPVYGEDDPRLARAPNPTGGMGRRWSGSGSSTPLGALPGSSIELGKIAESTPGIDITVLTGFHAGRAAVLAALERPNRLCHFAVHGLVDTVDPNLSGLLLSTHNAAGEPIQGLLTAHHIAGLNLQTDLVVLNACRSGDGKLLGSQGIVSLAQAFLAAGAEGVSASLWNVSDRHGAEMMAMFYKALVEEGYSAPKALRRTQLEMLSKPATRHPYYWGGHFFLGKSANLKP